jgi:hypothetical protein
VSNLDRSPALGRLGGLAGVAARPVHERFAGREVLLGESTKVRRLLPNLGRRLVGPWCFVDHYGPEELTPVGEGVPGGADSASTPGMRVPPHPHIGLQTVSWLLDGEVRHRDSIGNDQVVRPGELGLMTSGRGIAHAEHSPAPEPAPTPTPRRPAVPPALLHGAQLWVALPDGSRDVAPAWEHHANLPVLADSGMRATVLMGTVAGASSPGRAYSPLVGLDVALDAGGDGLLPLEPDFEYALLSMSGSVEVENAVLDVGSMLYLGCGRRELRLRAAAGPPAGAGARMLLLGGEPFGEEIVMWWNFVARSAEEIAVARARWEDGGYFGEVTGHPGERLAAPPLPAGRLKPGGSVRRRDA